MQSFLSALIDPSFPFIRNALIAALLSSILFGIVGAVVTVKHIASLAGAISHAVLGGIGIALFLSTTQKVPWVTPMIGAIVFAIIAAGIIGVVSRKAKQRQDTVIHAVWAIGMSIGVLFMAKTPGYTDPASYLFGNILLISNYDLWLLAILDIIVLMLVFRFYPHIEASSFDDEFSQVRGLRTNLLFYLLLSITAISVVMLQTFVGIVMVIAMLSLPAGTASYFARNLASMMIFGILFSTLFSITGMVIGWKADLPIGAMIVVTAGSVFLICAIATSIKNTIVRIRGTRS